MQKGVCFLGCESFKRTSYIMNEVYKYIKNLLDRENVCNFFFGKINSFSQMCYEVVVYLKKQYPYLRTFFLQARRDFRRFNNVFDIHILYNDIGTGKNNVATKSIEKLIELSDYCVTSFSQDGNKDIEEIILYNAEKMKKIVKNII